MQIGWHFTGKKLRDGQPIPKVGKWLEHKGEVKICESGLHFSRMPWDALQYAPWNIIHLVEVEDIVDKHEDKGVARKRRILCSMDAEEPLRYFARMQALSVVHLWDAPEVVLDYLITGGDEIRKAAEDAAWDAWAAARAAAWDAAMDAWAAAWDAAMDAAMDAAWAAAWDAARKDFNALIYECFEGPLEEVKEMVGE